MVTNRSARYATPVVIVLASLLSGIAIAADSRELSRDVPETDRKTTVGPSGDYTLQVPMRSNDIVLVEWVSQ